VGVSVIALRSIPAFVHPAFVITRTKAGMKRSIMTVTAEHRQQETLKRGAVRSKDGFLPRSNAVLAVVKTASLKIAIDSAQTLPYGSTPLFTVIGYLHSAKQFRA